MPPAAHHRAAGDDTSADKHCPATAPTAHGGIADIVDGQNVAGRIQIGNADLEGRIPGGCRGIATGERAPRIAKNNFIGGGIDADD